MEPAQKRLKRVLTGAQGFRTEAAEAAKQPPAGFGVFSRKNCRRAQKFLAFAGNFIYNFLGRFYYKLIRGRGRIQGW
jgi:hypothetical protein